MILIDRRIGSEHLLAPLRKLGLPAALSTMTYADVKFRGKGPIDPLTGEPADVRIGIERKTVSEIIGCFSDPRFAGHQLPGLLNTYDRVYLLVEGITKVGPDGAIEAYGRQGGWKSRRGSLLYSTFEKFLLTLQNKAGVTVKRTAGHQETLWWLFSVYQWWQQPWASHGAAYAVEQHTPDSLITEHQTLVRKLAAQIPDIGWKRSREVAQRFANVVQMVEADAAEWAGILTTADSGKQQRIGGIRGQRIFDALRADERKIKARSK